MYKPLRLSGPSRSTTEVVTKILSPHTTGLDHPFPGKATLKRTDWSPCVRSTPCPTPAKLPPLNPGQFSWLKPVSGKNTAKKPATKNQRMHFNNRFNMADTPAMLKMYIRHCMQFYPSKGRHGLTLNFLA